MPSYDDRLHDPPAPVALVVLRSSQGGAEVADVSLLIDTGADITLLPRLTVERLGIEASADEHRELIGFDGSRSLAPVVAMEMIFLGRIFRGRYLLIDGEQGVLGRNILNHVSLLLDGPRGHWSESVP